MMSVAGAVKVQMACLCAAFCDKPWLWPPDLALNEKVAQFLGSDSYSPSIETKISLVMTE